MKKVTNLFATLILTAIVLNAVPLMNTAKAAPTAAADTPPYLSVSSTTLGPSPVLGQLFNITVSLNNVNEVVQHLIAVQYRLQYDNNTLEAVNATEGPYFNYFASLEPGSLGTLFQYDIQNNLTYGWNVMVSQAVRPNATGKYNEPLPDGSGVIAIITFKVLYQPLGSITTPLTITDQLATGLDNIESQNQVAVPLGQPVNGSVTITYFLIGRLFDVFGGASNLGYGSGYPGPFPAPYGGQGPDAPMDLAFPESNITLFANVSYNWEPVQSVDVTFSVVGPSSSVTLYATTNAEGTANVTYSMPWSATAPQNFTGLWRVTANVTVIGVTIDDALTFFYDYPVHIWRVTTDKYHYNYVEVCTVDYVYGTLAMQAYPALFKVDLENSTGAPFSWASVITTIGGSVFGMWRNSTFTVGLYILFLPGVGGYSFVHMNCYDKDPSAGGVQLCPEYSPPVTIVVGLIGDITGPSGSPDGIVDMRDIGFVARHFGETVPPAPANCDLTGPTTGVPDGKVDMRDIGLVARHFGDHL